LIRISNFALKLEDMRVAIIYNMPCFLFTFKKQRERDYFEQTYFTYLDGSDEVRRAAGVSILEA